MEEKNIMINEDNFHKKVGNLILTNNQIKLLNENSIDIYMFKSNQELIFYLENILNVVDSPDLENLSLELSEMYYYHDVNK